MVVEIQKAKYIGEYKIDFIFSDGLSRLIDFEEFILSSNNPMTKKYSDKNLFKSFNLVYGDIVWNDFEMCFPIWDLHEGSI